MFRGCLGGLCTVVCVCVYSLLAEFDQVQVSGGRRKTTDVEVGLAELIPAGGAAVTTAHSTGASWGHGVGLHTHTHTHTHIQTHTGTPTHTQTRTRTHTQIIHK